MPARIEPINKSRERPPKSPNYEFAMNAGGEICGTSDVSATPAARTRRSITENGRRWETT